MCILKQKRLSVLTGAHNRLRFFQFIAVLTVCLALHTGPAIAGDNAVAVCTVVVNHAPPYRIIAKGVGSDRFSGIYIDIIKEAARRMGIRLHFLESPFARALKEMESGIADLMLGPNRKAARELYMIYLDAPLPRERKAFYITAGSPDITAYNELATRRIAVLRGSVYTDRFDDDDALQKVIVNNYTSALKMTAMKRVDAAIMPEAMGDYLVSEGSHQVAKASFGMKGRPSFITISKRSTFLGKKDELEKILRDMQADGSFDLIMNRYR